MTSIINKKDSIGKAKEVLNNIHGVSTPFGWDIVFGMLLDECKDHIEVHGFGSHAYFAQI